MGEDGLTGLIRQLARATSAALALLGMSAAFAQDPNHLVQTVCTACHNEYTRSLVSTCRPSMPIRRS